MKILLSKPIPEDGRLPTAAEIKQFRNLACNIVPTRSGAWRVGWLATAAGTKEPYINYFDRRSSFGEGWTFEAIQPQPPSASGMTQFNISDTVRIQLSKPIPQTGRLPTTDEIAQFRMLTPNIRPTRSGAWTLAGISGEPEASICYHNKRAKSGCSWTFEIARAAINILKAPTRASSTAMAPISWDF